MTKAEAMKCIAILQASFPRFECSRETLDAYADAIADLDAGECIAAVNRIRATAKFFPTIAEIREAVAEAKTSGIPSADQAWEEVRRAIASVGSYRNPVFSHAAIEHAVNVIGWQTLCFSEAIGVERAHFLKLYADAAQREKRDAQLGVLALPKPKQGSFPMSQKVEELLGDLANTKALQAVGGESMRGRK